MKQSYWLDPADRIGLLREILRHLAGRSHLVLEGPLDSAALRHLGPVSHDTVPGIELQGRNEALPVLVLPLTHDTWLPILEGIQVNGRLSRHIAHLQIVLDGHVAFMAGDHFHRGCISVSDAIPLTILEQLTKARVLHGFTHSTLENHGLPSSQR